MSTQSLRAIAIAALGLQTASFLFVLPYYPFFLMAGLMSMAGGGHGGTCRPIASFVGCVAIVGLLLVPLVQITCIGIAGVALKRGNAKSTLVFSLVPFGLSLVLIGSLLLIAR